MSTHQTARLALELDLRNEENVLETLHTPALLAVIQNDCLRRAHDFLLENLRFREAEWLRRAVASRLSLPSLWGHLAPFIAAIAGGALIVLDIGTAWSEIAVSGTALGVAGIVLLSLVGSFMLLAATLASRMAQRLGSEPKIRRWWKVIRRVAPAYGAGFGLSLVSSGVLLLTLEGTAVRRAAGKTIPFLPQLLIWSSMALFLGLFLGILMDRIKERDSA